MRCKACNKIMDTPANWMRTDIEEEDMCADCVRAPLIDWDTKFYAHGAKPVNGLTQVPGDSEATMMAHRNYHGFHEFTP